MKVVAFNASPRETGNTARMLSEVLLSLKEEGIEGELIHIGGKVASDCTGCRQCKIRMNQRCIMDEDIVNACLEKAFEADGLLFGSPTYFSGITGDMTGFIHRLGMVAGVNGRLLKRKPGAAVTALRRGGGVAAFDTMNHLFHIAGMYQVGANYWNLGFGNQPGEVEIDNEGMATMRDLGENMGWLLKQIEKE